jgi:hypothetical protein
MAAAEEPLELEVPEEQRRAKVYRHPDRETIHTLISSGKTGDWIARWLKLKYPIEDEMGAETEDAARNVRWHLTAATINRYRDKWMPEAAPGVQLVDTSLETALGMPMPVARSTGAQFELDVLEVVIQASMKSLGRALTSDEEMEMLQSVTLDAQDGVLKAVRDRVAIAQSLGVEGYPRMAERVEQKVDQTVNATTRNLNVELNGRVDAQGVVHPNEPAKVKVLAELMALSPEKADAIIDQAEADMEPQDAVEVEDATFD